MQTNDITEVEVIKWVSGSALCDPASVAVSWLTQILNGSYDLAEARKDILSFRKDIPGDQR